MYTPMFNPAAGAAAVHAGCDDHDHGPVGIGGVSDADADEFAAAMDGDGPVQNDEPNTEDPVGGKGKKSGKGKKDKSGKDAKSKKSGKGKKSKKDKDKNDSVEHESTTEATEFVDDIIGEGDTFDEFWGGIIDQWNDEMGYNDGDTPASDNPGPVVTPPSSNPGNPTPVTPPNDNTDTPPPATGGPAPAPSEPPPAEEPAILVNTVVGGTGQAQRDMDANREGTQINVVIAADMNKKDRKNALEALARWEEASNGELEFLVFEEGEQPGGQDYTIMRAVEPDGTTKAGVADVGRSPDGVTQMEFESGSDLAIAMHEFGHTLGLLHGDGVQAAWNPTEEFSEQNLADLAALYPGMNDRTA